VTDARYTYTAGMPAARVGWLVARARAGAGMSERDLASSVGVPVRTVRRWERGDLVPSDDEVEGIAAACGARLTELLPRRAVVSFDPATGIMQIGDQAVAIPVTSLDNDTVLAAFVALVRRVRGLRLDQDVKVRQEDLDALGEVLDVDDEELEERLMRIIGMSRSQAAAVRAQLLRKRLAVPMVGMLAGLSLLGINRLFTTGSEQVKTVDGKVQTVISAPSTTTTVAAAFNLAPVVPVQAPVSSAAPTSPTVEAVSATPAEASAAVTSTTQPFVGPKFPVTVRTGPPATTSGRRSTGGTTTPDTEPGTGGQAPTEPTQPPVTQAPNPQPPATQAPIIQPPPTQPTVLPVAPTDGTTGTTTTLPTAPPTTATTALPTTTTTPTTAPTPPTTTPTTTPVTTIDGGHTTETTPTPSPSSPPAGSGLGTTGTGGGTS
jgi:transcriptional regulator with XRE-family HTH domain